MAVASTGGFRSSPHICNTPLQLQDMLDIIAQYIAINPPPDPNSTRIAAGQKWNEFANIQFTLHFCNKYAELN